jgi:peptide/nickel transport system ATP-binding protein
MSSNLVVKDLVIRATASKVAIVDEVSFELPAGKLLGLVGESGSGKTTIGLAMLGHARTGTEIAGGSIKLGDVEITASNAQALRGKSVTYIPQSPASALNPALKLITQLRECLPKDFQNADLAIKAALEEVALPTDSEFTNRYPHQISGGQMQRVTIAMAFMVRPDLIVLDEPTTGLDVTTQRYVLETVKRLVQEHGVSAIYISHDLAVVSGLVDQVMVLYSGKIAEFGPNNEVIKSAEHPYTKRLIQAVPDVTGIHQTKGIPGGAPSPFNRPPGCTFHPRCELASDKCKSEMPELVISNSRHLVRCHFPIKGKNIEATNAHQTIGQGGEVVIDIQNLEVAYGKKVVLKNVNLEVRQGLCTAILGESGSGKTTMARAIAGLLEPSSGSISFEGKNLPLSVQNRNKEDLRRIQYIFQSPYESINPRRSVAETLISGYESLCGKSENPNKIIEEALVSSALRPDIAYRYPDQLSGGERQRVAIARALIVNPDILVCDEITSSLDVSVQASIVELLKELQIKRKLTLIFVTHNMALVRNIAQEVAVLQNGEIIESRPVLEVFANPSAEYTKALIADTPRFDF